MIFYFFKKIKRSLEVKSQKRFSHKFIRFTYSSSIFSLVLGSPYNKLLVHKCSSWSEVDFEMEKIEQRTRPN
jgi:hypothetical protein